LKELAPKFHFLALGSLVVVRFGNVTADVTPVGDDLLGELGDLISML